MSFIDDSVKNTKKYNSSIKERKKSVPLLKEVTGGEGVAGFVGTAGVGVDKYFSGGFNSKYNNLIKLLQKQLDDRKKYIEDFDIEEINPLGGFYDVDTPALKSTYEELAIHNAYNKEFNLRNTPPHDAIMKPVETKLKYDDIYIHIENEDDFINQSKTNMEYVGIDIKYDAKPQYADEDFINKSETNMEYVGVTIKYDDNSKIPTYNKKDFINKSENNWKIIGRTKNENH